MALSQTTALLLISTLAVRSLADKDVMPQYNSSIAITLAGYRNHDWSTGPVPQYNSSMWVAQALEAAAIKPARHIRKQNYTQEEASSNKTASEVLVLRPSSAGSLGRRRVWFTRF
jgi:hypothetical protein